MQVTTSGPWRQPSWPLSRPARVARKPWIFPYGPEAIEQVRPLGTRDMHSFTNMPPGRQPPGRLRPSSSSTSLYGGLSPEEINGVVQKFIPGTPQEVPAWAARSPSNAAEAESVITRPPPASKSPSFLILPLDVSPIGSPLTPPRSKPETPSGSARGGVGPGIDAPWYSPSHSPMGISPSAVRPETAPSTPTTARTRGGTLSIRLQAPSAVGANGPPPSPPPRQLRLSTSPSVGSRSRKGPVPPAHLRGHSPSHLPSTRTPVPLLLQRTSSASSIGLSGGVRTRPLIGREYKIDEAAAALRDAAAEGVTGAAAALGWESSHEGLMSPTFTSKRRAYSRFTLNE